MNNSNNSLIHTNNNNTNNHNNTHTHNHNHTPKTISKTSLI
jgi:hypothetical protein